jgi:hypothetical protein
MVVGRPKRGDNNTPFGRPTPAGLQETLSYQNEKSNENSNYHQSMGTATQAGKIGEGREASRGVQGGEASTTEEQLRTEAPQRQTDHPADLGRDPWRWDLRWSTLKEQAIHP